MPLRMVIIVRDDLPPNHVALACAHAAIAIYAKCIEHDKLMQEWKANSFRKVIRKATAAQFEQAKLEHPKHLVMTESSLDGRETAIVFEMAEEYPKFINYLPRY